MELGLRWFEMARFESLAFGPEYPRVNAFLLRVTNKTDHFGGILGTCSAHLDMAALTCLETFHQDTSITSMANHRWNDSAIWRLLGVHPTWAE